MTEGGLGSRRPFRVMTSGVLGGYEILGHIAQGGMATVYLCRRSREGGFQRLFALKVMHPHLASNEEFVRMLLDEAWLASRLHHPNVVSVVDVGSKDAGYYVVMDYVEGCHFGELLKRRTNEHDPVVPALVVLDVLRGLAAVHDLTDEHGEPLRLVHRDVSPQNILIGIDGMARLTDFGIAKAESRRSDTRPGIRKGKLEYMAPEQVRGERVYDRRADLFAAGVVLYEALTGEPLFRGESDAETLFNVLSKRIPTPSGVGHRPPPVFDAVVARATQRNPDDRYPTADEMARDLSEALRSLGAFDARARIADAVRDAFGVELEERRKAVSAAARRKEAVLATADGSMSIPSFGGLLPEVASSTVVTEHAGTVAAHLPKGAGSKLALGLLLLVSVASLLALGFKRHSRDSEGDRAPATAPASSPMASRSLPSPPSRTREHVSRPAKTPAPEAAHPRRVVLRATAPRDPERMEPSHELPVAPVLVDPVAVHDGPEPNPYLRPR